jgi:hypothetical protein
MVISVTSAPPVSTTSPSRGPTFFVSQGETGFARDYLGMRDTGTGTFAFAIRKNGAGNPWAFGTTALSYGTVYKVIMRAMATDTNQVLWVNPGVTENTNTAYLAVNNVGAFDAGLGSFSLQGQFTTASIPSPGYAVFKVCITTNYADAYNDVQSYGPPADAFTTWQSQYFGCTGCPQAAGNADPYGKGISNTNQFLAGFDPTNTTATVRILNAAKSGNDIVLTYRGANGNSTTVPPSASRTNVLESSPGTANGSYSNNFASTGQTNILSGGTGLGTVTSFTDVGGGSGVTKYYRVRVLVP